MNFMFLEIFPIVIRKKYTERYTSLYAYIFIHQSVRGVSRFPHHITGWAGLSYKALNSPLLPRNHQLHRSKLTFYSVSQKLSCTWSNKQHSCLV